MLTQVGRSTPPDKVLLELVLQDLSDRLAANVNGGMRPKLGLGVYQMVEDHRVGFQPWGTIQTFLIGSARIIREALADRSHLRGLNVGRDAFVQAFDLFHDPLVSRFLDGKPCIQDAKRQLEVIKKIENHAAATPQIRSNSLWKLLKGECEADVIGVLCANGQPV
jgi:hypothetical protein